MIFQEFSRSWKMIFKFQEFSRNSRRRTNPVICIQIVNYKFNACEVAVHSPLCAHGSDAFPKRGRLQES